MEVGARVLGDGLDVRQNLKVCSSINIYGIYIYICIAPLCSDFYL